MVCVFDVSLCLCLSVCGGREGREDIFRICVAHRKLFLFYSTENINWLLFDVVCGVTGVALYAGRLCL